MFEIGTWRSRSNYFSPPDCPGCGRTRSVLEKVVKDIGDPRIQLREINVVEEIDYAVALSVLAIPAIAVDGELAFSGPISEKHIRTTLQKKLAARNAAPEEDLLYQNIRGGRP